MAELRDDPLVVRADLTIRYLELKDKLTQPTCNITSKDAELAKLDKYYDEAIKQINRKLPSLGGLVNRD